MNQRHLRVVDDARVENTIRWLLDEPLAAGDVLAAAVRALQDEPGVATVARRPDGTTAMVVTEAGAVYKLTIEPAMGWTSERDDGAEAGPGGRGRPDDRPEAG